MERDAIPAALLSIGPDLAPVHVGCSGWFYWHWRGGFYATDLPTRDWFTHYADHFKTAELNAPFTRGRLQPPFTGGSDKSGDESLSTQSKRRELITHIKRFSGTRTLIRDFGHIADLLGPRMGCFLFQLPPSFHYHWLALDRILSQLDPARRNVVEFRHHSWWKEPVFAAFRASGTIFCSCSGRRLPDELVKTADDIYVRFHGIKQWYRHDYTPDELAVWAERIKASGGRVWAYFNNDRDGVRHKECARATLTAFKIGQCRAKTAESPSSAHFSVSASISFAGSVHLISPSGLRFLPCNFAFPLFFARPHGERPRSSA